MEDVRPLGISSRLWPDRVMGPWRLEFQWAVVDGRAECIGLDVRSFVKTVDGGLAPTAPGAAPEPINSSVLRGLPIGQLIAEQRAEQRDLRYAVAGYLKVAKEARAEARRQLAYWQRMDAPATTGRRRLPRAHFEAVAAVYQAAAAGAAGKPTKAVMDEFHVSKSTAAKWVARCRSLELLPPTSRGRLTRSVLEAPPPDKAVAERPAPRRKRGME